MNIAINKNGSESIYIQIKEQLKEYIADNDLREGDKLPGLKNIASTAGVSLRTAYLGVEALIKEGICYKRPKNGVFVKNRRERHSLRNICGIFDMRRVDYHNYDSGLVQPAIFKGISDNSEKYRTETFFITNDSESTIDFYGRIKELNMTGIFMLSWDNLEEGIHLAERFPQVKFVYLNYFLNDFEQTPENIYGVFNDDFSGAYQMCSHLLSKGCRAPRVFTFDVPSENYKRRVSGFLAGMEDNGFKPDSGTVMTGGMKGKRSLQELGRNLAESLCSSGSEVDTIMCVNDQLAEGVFDWLKENNIENTKVAGYDNIPKHVSANKGFSTVAIDFEKMGIKALDIISGRARNCPKIINIHPQVIEKGSYRK
ncbi:MAG: substrate-binding domain-containing protein [bacterium]|nr:substrate-binding domain-containing protein [bacterium]